MSRRSPSRHRIRQAVAAATLLSAALCPLAARAASDAEELEKTGYLGHWSTDCNQPASPANWHMLIQSRQDGSVVMLSFTGDKAPYSARQVEFLRRLDPTHFQVRLIESQPAGQADTVTMTIVMETARSRTMQSTSARFGEISRDGRLLRNGQAMPWLYRCRSDDRF